MAISQGDPFVDDIIQGQLDHGAPPSGGGLSSLGQQAPAPVTKPVNAGTSIQALIDRLSNNIDPNSASNYAQGLSQYTPNPAEKWLSFAANIVKPTKFGTMGEVVSNVAGGLEPIVSRENALKEQYRQLALQAGYQTSEKNVDRQVTLLGDMMKAQRMQGAQGAQSAQAANALTRQVMTMYTQQLEGARKQAVGMTNVNEDERNKWVTDTARDNTVRALDTMFTPEQIQTVLPHLSALLSGQPSTKVPAQQTGVPAPSAPALSPSDIAPGKRIDLGSQAKALADRLDILRAEKRRNEAAQDFSGARINDSEIAETQKRLAALGTQTAQAPVGAPETSTIAGRKAEQQRLVSQAEADIKIASERKLKSEGEAGTIEGKREAMQPVEASALAQYLDESKTTLRIAQKAAQHPGLQKATGSEGMIPFRGNFLTTGGSDAAGFKAKIVALGAQLGMQQLAAMKAANASGSAGLGQVTEAEHKLLQQQIDTLDLNQKPEEVQASLNNIQERLNAMQGRIVEAYGRKYPGTVRTVKGTIYIQGKDGLWQGL